MGIALLFFGALFTIAAVRGQQTALFAALTGDLTGPNNFLFWIAALFAVGAIGYVPRLKPLSVALLALVLVVIFVRKGTGFFAQLTQGLQATTLASQKTAGS